MHKDYKMITVLKYLENLDSGNCSSFNESDITKEINEYFIYKKRNETNEKILESMLS